MQPSPLNAADPSLVPGSSGMTLSVPAVPASPAGIVQPHGFTPALTSVPSTIPPRTVAEPSVAHSDSDLSGEFPLSRLRELERLAMLGELLGTTTHEFNNLIMTVINYAKLGLRNTDTAARENAFQRILAAGERCGRITSTILGAARNRPSDLEPLNLPQLVDDVLVLLERELNKYRIRVVVQHDSVPPVRGTKTQLQQVLLNILINARQAMPDGGEVRIRTQASQDGLWVELSIRDTGKGIPADQLQRIFDPYFSTKSGPDETGRGGTGLGLTACRDIIRHHQGKLRVESTVGKGTAFIIRLPIRTESG